jgi:hypothetical protein
LKAIPKTFWLATIFIICTTYKENYVRDPSKQI